VVSFLQNSPPKPCIRLSSSPYLLHAPPISFFFILSEEYRSLNLFYIYIHIFHSPVASSLFGPNILLNTTFSDTLSLRASLNISDQVSHPYKTTGKIIVHISCPLSYILVCLGEKVVILKLEKNPINKL
jgi:hypothetical protein